MTAEETVEVKIVRLQEAMDRNCDEHVEIKQSQEKIWGVLDDMRLNLLDEIKKRPPLWATFVMQFLTGLTFALFAALITIIKLKGL